MPLYMTLQHLLNVLAQIANEVENLKKYVYILMCFWPVNRISLRPGLLWLTLSLALIIQRLSRNVSSSILHTPYDVFAYLLRDLPG
jgi:hypothetical protein